MNKAYAFVVCISFLLLLTAYSNNTPDGKTGAPGDSLCSECHVQPNQGINGTIDVEGFPASIVPGEKYQLTVVNRNTVGDAVRAGFQMTILGPFNTKAGEMSNPSASSIIANSGGRQYFEHHPSVVYPDSNVVKWTVDWTAPEISSGSKISWYVAGNIANGNFQNVGDRVVVSNGFGNIILASTEIVTQQKPILYPNPGTDEINIISPGGQPVEGTGYFYNISGTRFGSFEIQQGKLNSSGLPSGMYWLEIRHGDTAYFALWSKVQ